jgi:hypothetical protein
MIGKKIRTRLWSWYGIHMNKKIRIRILVHFISWLLIRYRYHDMISKGSDQNRVRIFLFIWIPYQDQNRVRIFLLIISWYRYRISNREIERTRIRIQIFLFVISIPYQDQNRVRIFLLIISWYRYRISNREIERTRIRIQIFLIVISIPYQDQNRVRIFYLSYRYRISNREIKWTRIRIRADPNAVRASADPNLVRIFLLVISWYRYRIRNRY